MPPNAKSASSQPTQEETTLFGVAVHKRNDLHLYRRFQHAATGLVILYIYWVVLGPVQSRIVFPAVTGVFVLWEMARLSVPALNEMYVQLFKRLVRVEEKTRFTGACLYMIGLSITMLVAPPVVITLATCYLSFGDPAAAIVGTLSHPTLYRQASTGKSWIGGAGAALVNIIATFALFAYTGSNVPFTTQFTLGLVSGGVAGIADMLVPSIDDNIVIPLATVATAWPVLISTGVSAVSF